MHIRKMRVGTVVQQDGIEYRYSHSTGHRSHYYRPTDGRTILVWGSGQH